MNDPLLSTIPPELYFMILENLRYPDETSKASLAILNLARTSRSHFNLINYWTEFSVSRAEFEARDILEDITHGQTCLTRLCKQLSGICAICNNRANSRHNEFFTGLQLCQCCDVVYFPKISLQRLKELFRPNLPRKSELRSRMAPGHMPICMITDVNVYAIDYQDQIQHGPYYRWADVLGLVRDGLIERVDYYAGDDPYYNGEEYGYFVPADQELRDDERYWPEQLLLSQSNANGNINSTSRNVPPHIAEIMLFREFRYRFDPAWRREESLEKKLQEY
jgi:hypothetical protein